MLYAFGTFEFDDTISELRREGRLVALEPQPARALTMLLARAGDIVTREELTAHVWGPDTHVDFNRGLAYCMAQVRSALLDTADSPRFLQTLPRRGFRFIAPVTKRGLEVFPEGANKQGARGPHVARGVFVAAAVLVLTAAGGFAAYRYLVPSSRPVVAVTLFDNETGDSQYDRRVHALSDVMVDRLTNLGVDRIGVVGNAAVLRQPRSQRDLKRIAAETGASFVVLAQLQTKNGQLSFLIHLIRLNDGTHLWTRRIERPAGDTLAGLDEDAASLLEAAAHKFVLRDS